MVQDDLDNQEAVVKALNSSITDITQNETSTPKHSPLLEKQEEMNELWRSVTSSLKDKRNKMQEKLTSVSTMAAVLSLVSVRLSSSIPCDLVSVRLSSSIPCDLVVRVCGTQRPGLES